MKIWDLPTRLFHWLLVSLVAVGVVTGFVTPVWWMGVHIRAGYGLVALMAFRLVWGIFGPEYSRVVSFLYPPRDSVEHLRGLLLLLAMIACHVAGVVIESLLTHDNLVWSMVTGWKTLPPEAPVPMPRAARPVLAVALLAVLAGSAVGTIHWLSRLPPPHSLRALP